jgi:hypothetical protein
MKKGQDPKWSWSTSAIPNVVSSFRLKHGGLLGSGVNDWLHFAFHRFNSRITWIELLYPLHYQWRDQLVRQVCVYSRVPGIPELIFIEITGVIRLIRPKYSSTIYGPSWPSLPSSCAITSENNAYAVTISFRRGTLAAGSRDLKCLQSGRRASKQMANVVAHGLLDTLGIHKSVIW